MVLSLIPLHKSVLSGKSSIQTLTIIRIILNDLLDVHHELEDRETSSNRFLWLHFA
jgi:hypothetical protein